MALRNPAAPVFSAASETCASGAQTRSPRLFSSAAPAALRSASARRGARPPLRQNPHLAAGLPGRCSETCGFQGPVPRATPCFPAPRRGACAYPLFLPKSPGLSPRRLHKPSASANPGEGRALSCFAASQALTVLLRGSRSLCAPPTASRWSPFACCGAAFGISSRPAEPCRLARIFASLDGGLRGHSFCHSRESRNPKNNVTYVFRLLINPLGVNPLLQCLQ